MKKYLGSLLLLGLLANFSHAHFGHNYGRGIWHLEPQPGGLFVHVRLPMGLTIVNAKAQGWLGENDYLFSEEAPDKPGYYQVSPQKLEQNVARLGDLVARSMHIKINSDRRGNTGQSLTPELRALRVHAVEFAPKFKGFTEATASLAGELYAAPEQPTYVGDSVVDATLFYPCDCTLNNFFLQDQFQRELSRRYTVNLYLSLWQNDRAKVIRYGNLGSDGRLLDIDDIAYQSFRSFVIDGWHHLITGWDHLAFIILLTLAAMASLQQRWWRRLLLALTGFTLGHSVAILLGVQGIRPTATWFIPVIEIVIALTIAFMAIQLIRRHRIGTGIGMTTTIGLIHGYGFAAMLQGLVAGEGVNIWRAWLGFNVGIEVGQIAVVIVLATFALMLFALLRRVGVKPHGVNVIVGVAALALSVYWAVERLGYFV